MCAVGVTLILEVLIVGHRVAHRVMFSFHLKISLCCYYGCATTVVQISRRMLLFYGAGVEANAGITLM